MNNQVPIAFANTTGLARRADPDTSHDAARSVNATKLMDKIYMVMAGYGHEGCISDDVGYALHPVGIGVQTYTPRFMQMIERGMIEETGEKRKGASGRMQLVRRVKPMPFVPQFKQTRVTPLAKARKKIKALETTNAMLLENNSIMADRILELEALKSVDIEFIDKQMELEAKLDAVRNGLHLPKITPEIEDLLQGSYLIESGDWTQDAVEFVCILAKAIAEPEKQDG